MTVPDISVQRIGSEQQPIVIVDGFHPDPDALRALAAAASFERARHHYPGIRAALADDYFAQVRPLLADVLRDVFGLGDAIELIDASFSIVTTPPTELSLAQRLPHVDATGCERIALVHYLSPEGGDGTAFFRHRASGFETIDDARSEPYFACLNAELRAGPPPPAAYVCDSDRWFERIALSEGRYNRAVIYRSGMLHSGAIRRDAPLDADPATGRLTITAFLAAH